MAQHIVFELVPTEDPDKAVGHARTVIGADRGMGFDILEKIIEEHIPVVDDERVRTTKKVIRTARYECPCCHTSLTALVQVYCEGTVTDAWDAVEGLYRVGISPDHGFCRVVVQKLEGKVIHEGTCEQLPRKDYQADPEAKAEIEERDKFFADLARKRPGQVLQITGVETPEDFAKMIQIGVAFAKAAKAKDEDAEDVDGEDEQ